MKTIRKIIIPITIMALFFSLSIISCKKNNPTGSMTVRMTDAPASYDKVNVELVGFKIHYEQTGWVDVPIVQGIYNLLDLRNNVSVTLANQAQIPVGKINQIRLILGANNTLVINDSILPLVIPSGAETGLKLNVNEFVASNQNLDMLVDFDANASVVVGGNGQFTLKPVLKIKTVKLN